VNVKCAQIPTRSMTVPIGANIRGNGIPASQRDKGDCIETASPQHLILMGRAVALLSRGRARCARVLSQGVAQPCDAVRFDHV